MNALAIKNLKKKKLHETLGEWLKLSNYYSFIMTVKIANAC